MTCIGEGPVVHIMPNHLNWEQIPVLTDLSKTVRLSNESLIPAKFTVCMVGLHLPTLQILFLTYMTNSPLEKDNTFIWKKQAICTGGKQG